MQKTSIKNSLNAAIAELASSPTPKLDAEVLLMHMLKITRAELYMHFDRELNERDVETFNDLIAKRKAGEPVAYLIGHKDFWSLNLSVTPDVLIPRPETELLVEKALTLFPEKENIQVLDLGTGSGAIALAIAHERPNWQVTAVDQSLEALQVAEHNAQTLKITNVSFKQSDWFQQLVDEEFHIIVANPPYIAESDRHLAEGDVRFEPTQALVSGDNGLNDVCIIVSQAQQYLKPAGFLLLEHGYDQAEKISAMFVENNFVDIQTLHDLSDLPRVTVAQTIKV